MDELDREIEAIERKLSQLKAARVAARGNGKSAWRAPSLAESAAAKRGPPIVINGPSELRPDFSVFPWTLLENVPVQIFVKEADVYPGIGRRYIYLNAAARKIVGWGSELDVSSRFDSEAVAGGYESAEYQAMCAQESTTLRDWGSRWTRLEWSSAWAEGGWRRNQTLEISIVDGEGAPIGFCAVAEDIEFKLLPALHSWLRKVFQHEYNNASTQVVGLVFRAEEILNQHTSTTGGAETTEPTHSIGIALQHLESIKRRVLLSSRVATALIDAFANIHSKSRKALRKVEGELQEIYKTPPFLFKISPISHELGFFLIRKPEAIVGVLVELISNAVKHSAGMDSETPIIVNVEQEKPGVIAWIVSNRAKGLTGNLKIEQIIDAIPIQRSSEIGSAVISEILSRAFPSEDIVKMVIFPTSLDAQGLVHVRLRCSEEPRGVE